MARFPGYSRLMVWSLATFHTTFFAALLVALLYLSGALARLLASLNTLVGIMVFGILWAATWFCTRQGLRRIAAPESLEELEIEKIPVGRALMLGALWGGVDGILFFLALVGILILTFLVSLPGNSNPASLGSLLPFLVITSPIETLFAFLVGALVGFVFALLDGALLRGLEGIWRANAQAV